MSGPLMRVDSERGMVFLPVGSPAYDFYGGDRKGDNLFGNSLVALDAATGKRLWRVQLVHHDVWDYDLPAQPNLVTVRQNGRAIPAVAQVTTMGLVFLFDRVSGKPLFPIEERPAPQSEVPGEVTSPTQPAPRPRLYEPQYFAARRPSSPTSRPNCASLVPNCSTSRPAEGRALRLASTLP